MRRDSYALDAHQFHAIEIAPAGDIRRVRAWLAERIGPAERLFVVFDRESVGAMSAASFLDHWQDMFVPARDDVLITNEPESWTLFYYHEDQFHFGRTKCA